MQITRRITRSLLAAAFGLTALTSIIGLAPSSATVAKTTIATMATPASVTEDNACIHIHGCHLTLIGGPNAGGTVKPTTKQTPDHLTAIMGYQGGGQYGSAQVEWRGNTSDVWNQPGWGVGSFGAWDNLNLPKMRIYIYCSMPLNAHPGDHYMATVILMVGGSSGPVARAKKQMDVPCNGITYEIDSHFWNSLIPKNATEDYHPTYRINWNGTKINWSTSIWDMDRAINNA